MSEDLKFAVFRKSQHKNTDGLEKISVKKKIKELQKQGYKIYNELHTQNADE